MPGSKTVRARRRDLEIGYPKADTARGTSRVDQSPVRQRTADKIVMPGVDQALDALDKSIKERQPKRARKRIG